MNKGIAILFAGSLQFLAGTVAEAQLTDEQLLQIQYEQKPGSQVRPTLEFTDETGKAVRLGDYFGERPSVLVLGYYGCPMLCTLVLNGAANCFRNMDWKPGQQFNVLFAGIDPEERPPLAAAKKESYVRSYGKTCAGNWHFLTGDPNSISNLTTEVGFRYRYDPSAKQFAHPSGLVILSPDGKVRQYLLGINFSPADVDQALRNAALSKTAPAEAGFTLLCFHYVPIHGKYGNLVMLLVRGSAIILVALLAGLFLLSPSRGKTEKPK